MFPSKRLSNQFSTFGRLFEDAIELGLPAIQTQHPGFYYQQAALQAVARKRAVLQDSAGLSPEDLAAASSVVIENETALEFYGQRPWRYPFSKFQIPKNMIVFILCSFIDLHVSA